MLYFGCGRHAFTMGEKLGLVDLALVKLMSSFVSVVASDKICLIAGTLNLNS